MSKKFLSDVLIECGLQVSGTTTLGTATATTVATSDNSTNIATTAFVKAQGYITGYTNNYVTGASFNTANGVLTLSRQGLTDVTVDLDNRYLTAEADTLDTVTSRSGVTTNTIGVGTINVTGSTAGAELLTVDGSYGRLFTVTDDLTDSLFSVNTVAGLPALEVFADNSIKLGAFANPIEIDSSSNIVIPGTITASGYNDSNWNAAYNDRIVSAAVTGTTTKTITLNQQDGGTVTATWTDINTDTDGYVSGVSLSGNSLTFTGVGSAFSGSVDLSTITSSFNASDVTAVYERVKNVSGAPIFKGTPLAVVPGQTSGNISDVIPADASDPAKMPAIFIANEDMADGAEGEAVLFGNITGIDTSLYESGTTVYVAPGGGWTDTKPDGNNLIQNLGVITKQHPTNGGGIVTGVGRANAVPNIPNGYAWVGNANGVATPTQLGSAAYASTSDFAAANHNHDSTYVNVAGDTMTGNLILNNGVELRSKDTGGTARTVLRATSNDELQYGWSAAGPVQFMGGGSYTERMRIHTNGNIGIGTSAPNHKVDIYSNENVPLRIHRPSNANLDSSGAWGIGFSTRGDAINSTTDTRAGIFSYYNGNLFLAAANTSIVADPDAYARLTVLNTGYVGIGTSSPSNALDILGKIKIDVDGTYGGGYGTIGFGGTTNGYNRVFGNNGTGDGLFLASATGVGIYFRANGGATDHMTVAPSGNVGIGTTNPTKKLVVAASSQTWAGAPQIAFYDTATGQTEARNWTVGAISTNWGNFTIASSTAAGGDPTTARFTINNAGNVGIGTIAPGYKLDVNGSVFGTSFTVTGGFSIQQAAGTATYGMTTNWLQMNGHGIYTTTSTYLDLDSASSTYSVRGFNNDPFAVFANTGTDNTARLVYFLPNGGNFGIGTTNPASKLHSKGEIRVDFNDTDGSTYITGYGVEFERGTNYLRPRGADGTQTLHLGGANDSLDWNNINFKVSSHSQFRVSGSDIMRINATGVGIGTTSPTEKLHIVGNVNIDNGSTSVTLETTDKVADPVGAVYATYPTNSTYGAFVDYVVYDSGRDSMRVGTMRATWNANEVVYADVSTVDIGDTSVVTMTAVLNGTDVDLVVTGDSVFTVKLNVKVIR